MLHPFNTLCAYKELKEDVFRLVKTGDYNMVMISSFALASLSKKIKEIAPELPIVMDLHGAAEDSLELAKRSVWKKKVLFHTVYNLIQYTYKKYYRYASGSMVVTEALEEYVKRNYTIALDFKFYRIPCATSTNVVKKEDYLRNRKQYREKYQIADDEIVFIYSGGVSAWQCVEETIDLYKKLASMLKLKTRMLVFSHNIEHIKAMAGDCTTIQTDSYGADELTKALCAGDYAFMLRQDCITNNVAFPNKFLEYVQSGMCIITTPYVHEIYKQTVENNLGVIYKMDGNTDELTHHILGYRLGCNFDEEKIIEVLKYNSFAERLPKLAADIK